MHIDPLPVLIGMYNPHSANPRSALLPFPKGSAGYRLRDILNAHRPITRCKFMAEFDRRNVLDDVVWDRAAALASGDRLRRELIGRRVLVLVLVLGVEAVRALRLPVANPQFTWFHSREFDFHWAWAPHPSGLSRAYNDPENRLRLAAILCTMLNLREMRVPSALTERPSTAPAPVASGAL